HTRFSRDWSSDVCSSDLITIRINRAQRVEPAPLETLVAQFGQESVDEFRKQVRESLEQRAERESQSALHEQIRDYLLEKTELERSEERRVGKEERGRWKL